ncbi:AAA family ATPase [Vibrio cholerae]|uniref:AAA family ATPase n=1 Tax=Vibrio cholerae TaxID=666 RepID=UPI0011571BD3|nr:AAA family ATPase [Vibrio cholerae]TQP41878.1 AAA family ATPase [Vibrio cholerae]
MAKSHIESLHVKNVRQFKELKVNFNQGFNFLAGPNGCGKTSVLACISHCFHYANLAYSRFDEESEFWTDLDDNGTLYRVGLGKGSINGGAYRQSSVKTWNKPSQDANRTSLAVSEVKDKLKSFCPLFIGANRSIKYKQISGMSREQTLDQKISIYTTNNTKSLYGDWNSDIKQWLVNRYFMIDKEWAIEERENWYHLVNSLPSIGPFDSKFSFVRIGKELEPVFSIYENECHLEELSSGFQAVLSIIANIFEWVEGSREDGERIVKSASGTVLIDELDLHLHPEWQFTIRKSLETIFPNIQFIVTTHSPHLLSSAKEKEVIIMPENGSDKYELSPSKSMYSGWNTDQILSEIMGVKSLDSKIYEEYVAMALEKVESNSVPELRLAISNLEKICHPNDSIITVLKARLASMVALQDD